MSRLLVVYGSAYGQTERIAHRIALGLTQAGHRVSTFRGDHVPPALSLAEYDGVVVAASVLFGKHQRYIEAFVRAHLDFLNTTPSAFVSVCGAAIGSAPEGLKVAQGYADKFLQKTGWRPTVVRSFGGGLPYTKYGLFTRWMMKMISRKTGRPTDTSRDHDFTDWDAVDSLARELADVLGPIGAMP